MQRPTTGKEIIRERQSVRWLLWFYDSIIYVLTAMLMLWIYPYRAVSLTALQSIGAACCGYVCIFAFRFIFHIYHQIWRYGDVKAFIRLFAADGLGGILFELLRRTGLVPNITFSRAVALVALDLILCLIMRLLYQYFYECARRETGIGAILRSLLERFGRIDFDSDEPGAVLNANKAQAQSSEPINQLQNIVRRFAIHGRVTKISQITKGYINRTYRVETLDENGKVHKYALQRINTNVFPDVDALMENFVLVTRHLHDRYLLPGQKGKGSVQMVKLAADGRPYFHDDSGYWRMMSFFDDVYSLDIPDRPETFYYAGQAFGMFVREMADVDIDKIHVVIPNFHNTWSRYQDLVKAIAEDPVGRVKDVGPEISFVHAHKELFSRISEPLEAGEIPLRICHNDCNLNNILFDNETHLPVAVIDLDTVMPSSPLYDYGDSMRIGTNTATDDEKDLSKVSCDLNLYEQYARGYLETFGDMMTKRELELLPYASLVITSEDGIRFLMDHINGDTYYNIFYPGQNLDRARTQLKLLEDMENKLPQIREILQKLYGELGLDADVTGGKNKNNTRTEKKRK